MTYVDRPLAEYVHRTLEGTRLATWAMRLLASLPALLVVAVLLALGVQGTRGRGKAYGSWLPTLWLGVAGTAVALLCAVALKFLFGRADADPTYVVFQTYGFHLFHGGRGYEAFPSATTAGATAFVTVWWLRVPSSRFLAALLLAAVLTAIVVTNGHWVTDVLGGGFLGAFIAAVVVQAKNHGPAEAQAPRAG